MIIGLTGGIGSGKSSVAERLAERGAIILDADLMARQAVEPGTDAHKAIVERFGIKILAPDGSLDRQKVADIAFSDPTALTDLNAITHPAVGAMMAEAISVIDCAEQQGGDERIVVLDIPLLTASTRQRYPMEGVIVVDCSEELRTERLVTQRKMNVLDARARMAAQIKSDERLKLADIVVDNSGTLEDLDLEVEKVWKWAQSIQVFRAIGSASGMKPAN